MITIISAHISAWSYLSLERTGVHHFSAGMHIKINYSNCYQTVMEHPSGLLALFMYT